MYITLLQAVIIIALIILGLVLIVRFIYKTIACLLPVVLYILGFLALIFLVVLISHL